MKRFAIAAVLVLASAAHADDDDVRGAVVYAKGTSLWKTDARGRGKPVELVALPDGARAESVRAIRADASGRVLLVDVGGTWYWSRIADAGDHADALAPTGCGAGGATSSLDGALVSCADAHGKVTVRKLGTDVRADRDVPAAGAVVTGAQGARALVWADGTGVWSAPIGGGDPKAPKRPLATEPPLAHFSPSPDGTRALGVYKAADDHDAQLLYSFPLDGSGARRKVIRNGVPIEWSWDSKWVLVQDRGAACVMRAVGGEYKCWKGYTAVGIAGDGAWALLLGPRDSRDKGRGRGKGEESVEDEGDDSADAVDTAVPLPKRPFSLFRARRDGAYTDRPVAIVKDVDGPAAWLPAPASAP